MSALTTGWTATDEAKAWARLEEETRALQAQAPPAEDAHEEPSPAKLWTRSEQAASFLEGLEGLAAREQLSARPLSAESEHDIAERVDHPSHYHAESGLEVIDIIEAWQLNFNRGNALKYIARAGHKDPAREAEDLRKALWYIRRELQRIQSEG